MKDTIRRDLSVINVELLKTSNLDELNEVYTIYSDGYYGTSLEKFRRAIENVDVAVLVAKDEQAIVGISILCFYKGRQMWNRGETLCDMNCVQITDKSNYEEIAIKLYATAKQLSNDRKCIKLEVTDFEDRYLFAVIGLDYDRCRCDYHFSH